jgi:hypothetical protein
MTNVPSKMRGGVFLSFWRRRVRAYTNDLLAEVLTLQ